MLYVMGKAGVCAGLSVWTRCVDKMGVVDCIGEHGELLILTGVHSISFITFIY